MSLGNCQDPAFPAPRYPATATASPPFVSAAGSGHSQQQQGCGARRAL